MIVKILMDGGGLSFIILEALRFVNLQRDRGYRLTSLSVIAISLIIIAIFWTMLALIWRDIKKQKAKTGFDSLVGKEAEITELSSSGKKGWLIYEGENWKFSSVDNLKIGDIVRILSSKRMVLKVKKMEGSNE